MQSIQSQCSPFYDPSSLWFEKIMARFDRLEFMLDSRDRRFDKLETPRIPDPDPPYFSDDAVFDGHRSQRDGWTDKEDVPWPFNHGRRDHGGDIRRRRGDARDFHNRGGRFPQFGVTAAPYRSRPDTQQRSSWDRPTDRYPHELERGFRGSQQPTRFCPEQPPGWPPPQHSPPSYWPAQRRRNAYGKQQQTHAYRQQHQHVAAHMEPFNRICNSRPRHQSNPTPVFEHSSYTCMLSDAALQNPDTEYQPHEPPARMEPPDCIFQPLPQPPLPNGCQDAADEESCLGEVITHTHSPPRDECLDSSSQKCLDSDDDNEDAAVPLPAEDEDRTEAAEQVTEAPAEDEDRTEAAEQETAAEQERTEVPSRSLRPRESSMKKREAGTIVDMVVAQTTAIAEKISYLTNVAWAYESVWATGTDVAAQIKISYGVAVKSVALNDWASINLTRKYGKEFMKRTESSMFLKSFGWNKFSVIEFDPGGDTSKLQFLTFLVVSWFPP